MSFTTVQTEERDAVRAINETFQELRVKEDVQVSGFGEGSCDAQGLEFRRSSRSYPSGDELLDPG
ncbi:hypothetical protein ACRE_035570 [Hapsidospora chrysogenum ATCC 11550]|uniref:Uncharacterized protein n=1 Tax=Hapsidospora chrysogenum (strain ATCC 11550 / CBS 779.69 / DSM 880 / IAM 14645 / JCM 23072 / IMI 49137) TaxID=857340 RepID=A0A086T8I7_HAPC1|nr:hypothetical protein ACRE_035570 [Hapsidospora chrysogenum ATCC 11550]